MKNIRYVGCRNVDGDLFEVVVERQGQRPYHLDARLDLVNHSPTGIAWGYGGSGPAQLALAILADYLDDDRYALRIYQHFKWSLIANLPMDHGFEISARQIESAITEANLAIMQEAR
ncbi:MAG TPA: DUF6166 domain-containing protein [Candidatus Binatia bacterium]|nr:DUF6166 domain-containing protein [Candidatus Binatia bacterium]